MDTTRPVPIGARIGHLATAHPDEIAVTAVSPAGDERTLTWRQLDERTNAAARLLQAGGIGAGSLVAVRLPNSLDHVIATMAVWKASAVVLPLDPKATPRELAILVDTTHPAAIITADPVDDMPPQVTPGDLLATTESRQPLPSMAEPRSAHATGGSTGRPRIVVRQKPWTYPTDLPGPDEGGHGFRARQVQLVMVPLHHAGFSKLYDGLALGHRIVLMQAFLPKLAARLISEHRVQYFVIVPAMMRALLAVPELPELALDSVTAVHQSSAGCPAKLKHAWFKSFPPHTLYEGYSSQERIGAVWIRGDEWLAHPGSVGKPGWCEVRVLREDGSPAALGETGEIFLRSPVTRQPEYIGPGPLLPQRDGFLSLGDAGFLDADGYLHVVGRQTDMINVGGTKVYPAEVEEVLLGHPQVADAVVTHRANDYLGQVVHAVIVPTDPDLPPSGSELSRYCRALLSLAKVPLSYQVVDRIPRTDAGKLRRAALPSDT